MRFRVLTIFSLLALSYRVDAQEKFDFAATPGKLPKNVLPLEYAIRIAPDLNKLTFTGSETVKLKVEKPVTKIVLNALEMEIASGSIDGQSLPKKAIELNEKEETLSLTLANELAAGEHELALKFSGKINPQGQGLFYAPYRERGTNEKKIMLGTQFEAADARRMFPCWDEPSFRARFQLTAVVPEKFMAVSNMPVEEETKADEVKEVRFGMSPSMSSYLVVLCAGELDAIESEQDGVKLRVIATKGKAEMGRYALESEAKILHYYNEYFGIRYPLPKLDLIALPGGFGGAMENWGGITFYESVLLFDPENSSSSTKQDIFAVIAHEMAHQWFGDLVTMAWWDNLWLNEGFASWMGSKCTDHFNPSWNEWLRRRAPRNPTRRIGFPKDTAMQMDARSTTHSIQQPIATEAEANSAFDEITYLKGQSIIRMLESFLSENVFRDGIRKYISAHKYSNTTTADLWEALTEVSGKPVGEIATGWTEQPGFPLVKVSRDASTVTLTQERFTVHFPNPPAQRWQVPLTYVTELQPATNGFLLRDKSGNLPNELPADRALKLNVGDAGYYRVEYDDASWKMLISHLGQISEADRVNLLTDAWALVEANREPLSHYLGLVTQVLKDDQLTVYNQIIDTFIFINRLLAGDPARPHFQQYARVLLRPAFDRVGWEAKEGEPAERSFLRAALIRGLGFLDDSNVVAGCRARFERFLSDRAAVAPDLRPDIFAVVGRYADAESWEKLHKLGLKTTSTEEKQTYYEALANAIEPALVRRTLPLALTDELSTSRAAYLLPFVARQGEHPGLVWDFAREHMKELLAKQDALGSDAFAPGLFTFFSDLQEARALEKYAESDLPPSAAGAVAKAVDEIGFRAEFKQRLRPQLKRWMEKDSR
ncbi:MAG TPA: M1 family metallopeptidase [Chthoniobacterales bacterium]|jgi:aminopeptidase N|nr:M1 family metallopeptidase [Chthoniobacterales bacterium]